MGQARRAPGSVCFTADEIHRIERARLAVLLGRLPAEIDSMTRQDALDVLAVV